MKYKDNLKLAIKSGGIRLACERSSTFLLLLFVFFYVLCFKK